MGRTMQGMLRGDDADWVVHPVLDAASGAFYGSRLRVCDAGRQAWHDNAHDMREARLRDGGAV